MEVGQVVIWVAFSGNYSASLGRSRTVNTTFMNLYSEDFNQNTKRQPSFRLRYINKKLLNGRERTKANDVIVHKRNFNAVSIFRMHKLRRKPLKCYVGAADSPA